MQIIHIVKHTLFSEGLDHFFRQHFPQHPWRVFQSCDDAESFLARQREASLVLVDGASASQEDIALLRRLARCAVPPAIVVFTESEEIATVKRWLDEGALAVVPKFASRQSIRTAIEHAINGVPSMPDALRARFAKVRASTDSRREVNARSLALTRKQLAVLDLLVAGHQNQGIARSLGVSNDTIKYHIKALYRGLGASNRVECIKKAKTAGLF